MTPSLSARRLCSRFNGIKVYLPAPFCILTISAAFLPFVVVVEVSSIDGRIPPSEREKVPPQ